MRKFKKILSQIVSTVTFLILSVGFGFFSIFLLIGLAGSAYLYNLNRTLPSFEELVNRDVPQSSKVYSRDGTLIYEFHGEYKRTNIDLDRVSPYIKNATVAIEDRDFYNHGAVSITGIGRALLVNYKNGGTVQGGSTITQQFVKNALLTDKQRSFSRKIKEVLLAYKIESHYSKDEILSLYLNEIPYGRNAYGIEAASQTYFGKSAGELTLAESAYLAALPQAPSKYSPTGKNTDALEARKNIVLEQMLAQKYITALEMHQAQYQPVSFKDNNTKIIAPYFVSWIQNYLTDKYGKQFLREGGLKVYTTLDLKLQGIAEQVVKEGAEINGPKYGAYNAALVAVEPSSGKILAMVGGKDYFGEASPAGCTPGVNCKFEPNTNAATAQRQPGSSFKIYTYLTAFKPEFGMTPMSTVLDAPTTFGYAGGRQYSPKNYDGSYHGLVSLRKALAGSLNIPAVKTMAAVGVDNVAKTAHDLGITAPLKNCGLSMALGSCEIELVDHVSAVAVIANGGKGTGGTPFVRIEDKNGKILEEYQEPSVQAVNPEAVYELTSIMTDNSAREYIFGKNSPLTLSDRLVAAKTGTTQNWKDGWTVGFTPQLAAGVWAGNNNGALLHAGADGVFVAAPIWHKFMEEALKDAPVVDFPVPSGIVQIAYDAGSNKPATKDSRTTRMEPFPWYALPKDAQITAAPRSNSKGLLVPLDSNPAPQSSAESNSKTPVRNEVAALEPPYVPSASDTSDLPDYGGVPNDYPSEPTASPIRPGIENIP